MLIPSEIGAMVIEAQGNVIMDSASALSRGTGITVITRAAIITTMIHIIMAHHTTMGIANATIITQMTTIIITAINDGREISSGDHYELVHKPER